MSREETAEALTRPRLLSIKQALREIHNGIIHEHMWDTLGDSDKTEVHFWRGRRICSIKVYIKVKFRLSSFWCYSFPQVGKMRKKVSFLRYIGVDQQPWRRKWQPTPVFLPGESQGWGSLVGCRLWGRTESDTTETT